MSSPARPAALLAGFLGGGVAGATLSAFIAGIVLEKAPLILFGVGLPIGYGFLVFVAGIPRRTREAAVVPRLALARIESLRAGGTETGDVPVDFELTIAPGGEPPFRSRMTSDVNLVDLPRYRPGDVLVVAYPPDRPWRATIVPNPTPEWQHRAAEAVIRPAPESPVVQQPPEGWGFALAGCTGLLLGAAIVLGLFRVELFTPQPPPAEQPPASSSSSTTITVGPRQEFPDAAELRRTIELLAATAQVPLDRIPELAEQATSVLDVGWPRSWQITVTRADVTTVRLTVTGPGGSASLVLPPG
ncbi:hypothetical protein SAMN04489727_5211 [Amycolatopsis tolypomycina]|uniref:DUF3592 domain-containing protein n=1 Tax=Amycolatopsis tolypomycina TaxID=208445 RepID=A0A1H4VNL7_9PSEU|nr:DUF3592 domain-containing protein [Amycolatopsis tolypomycina]SEC81914.1 hypothetical protein SAMN04489727_5211 [Amycolatopsis tolypomycina]